jgi:hypothetical protein
MQAGERSADVHQDAAERHRDAAEHHDAAAAEQLVAKENDERRSS